MKLTLDGTPDEIRQFLRVSAGGPTAAAPSGIAAVSASSVSRFSAPALQLIQSNVDTLQKVQTMMAVHENVFAAARFDRPALEQVIHPEIKYFEFGKPIDPPGIEGVSRRFAEFHDSFQFDKIDNVVTFGDGEYLANVYEVEATHGGEYEGVAPTNQRVKINGIGVLRVQDGRVTEYYDAYDTAGILPQLARPKTAGRRRRQK